MSSAPPATVTILYFAWLRERTGTGEETLALPPGIDTVGNLMTYLANRGPGHASAFAQARTIRCASTRISPDRKRA